MSEIPSMTIRELLRTGEEALCGAKMENAAAECAWILEEYLGLSRSMLLLKQGEPVPPAVQKRFEEAIGRRVSGEPLQYILGCTDFMGLPFHVDSRCLIPRQDTEPMVEHALALLETCEGSGGRIEVLDIGCGSGAIGLSLAKLYQGGRKLHVTLVDISEGALAVTAKNAKTLDLSNVTLLQGNLLEPVSDQKFDMILSNPPYIPSKVIEGLQIEIREHEPMLALDGGEDGLEIYRRLIPQISEHLLPGGHMFLEIGDDQREAVCALAEETCAFEEIHGETDLAGKDRCVYARKI